MPRQGLLCFCLLLVQQMSAASDADTLAEVVVSEQAGYAYPETNTATRIDAPLLSTPYSVGVVNRALLQDSLGYRLEDIAQFVSGVSQSSADSGFNTDLRIRGFTTAGSAYLDGVLDNQRFQVRDMALIEQVDILKGHSSVLYGAGAPGGTVNYVSKKPQAVSAHRLSYATGSYDFNRAVADSTGALNNDNSLLYRVIAVGQLADSFRENITNDRATIAPSLTWRYGNNNALNVGLEYGYQNQPYLFDNVYTQNRVVFDQSYVDPRARSDRHYWRFSSRLDHNLSKAWSLHFASHYFHVERSDALIGFNTFTDSDTVSGYYRDIRDHYDQYSLRGEARGQFIALGAHHWISGIERNAADDRLHSQRKIDGNTLDVFRPVFNYALPVATRYDSGFRRVEYGFYSNDQIDLNSYWHVSGGVRYSLFDDERSLNDKPTDLPVQKALTYSAGISFTPSARLAGYYGYSQSFQPHAETDRHLRALPAKHGELHEVGVKSLWFDEQLNISAALYRLRQSHLAERDPADRDYAVAIGNVESHGFEFDAVGQASERWQWVGNYSWTEAGFGKGSGLRGKQFRSTPRHSGSLWLLYHLPLNMPGALRLGGGLVVVGRRFGDDANTFKVPGYARADLALNYRIEKLDFRVKVENLLDKRYVSSSISNDTVIQGNRLFFQFYMGIRFD